MSQALENLLHEERTFAPSAEFTASANAQPGVHEEAAEDFVAFWRKQAMDRIRAIRRLDKHHHFTLVCRDLSEIATYARVDNTLYRLLKSLTPGPYTFLLRATGVITY